MIENIAELKAQTEKRVDKLFTDGMLLDLNVYKWSGISRLMESDLYITDSDESGIIRDSPEPLPDIFKLGGKYLVKPAHIAKFATIESQARSYLKRKSFNFPIAQAHFVPLRIFDKVITRLETLRGEYYQARDFFMDNLSVYKEEMFAEYPKYAPILRSSYPDDAVILSQFYFGFTPFRIAMPKVVQEDISKMKAQEIVQAQYQNKFAEEFRQKCDSFVSDAVTSLRGKIVETFSVIGRKITDREVISKTNILSMINVMEAFEDLDFTNDKVIKERLDSVKNLLTSNNNFKTNAEAVTALGTAVNQVLEAARSTTDIDSVSGSYLRDIAI